MSSTDMDVDGGSSPSNPPSGKAASGSSGSAPTAKEEKEETPREDPSKPSSASEDPAASSAPDAAMADAAAAPDENKDGLLIKNEHGDDSEKQEQGKAEESADISKKDDGDNSILPKKAKEEEEEEKKDDGNKKDDGKTADAAAPATAAAEKKKTVDWPLKNIDEPHDNDVLYGRGGGTNHHPGNKRYRKMVEDRKLEYVNSKRLDKPLVALGIIREWRAQDPPGRFLKIDERTGLWSDVGDKKAREKTSQALREKAPLIRKQQEEERMAQDGDGSSDEEKGKDGGQKTTRFAEGTNLEGKKDLQKAILARDHSLGREYLDEGEAVTLDGFSWQDPFQNGSGRPSKNGAEQRSKKQSTPPTRPSPPPSTSPTASASGHSSSPPTSRRGAGYPDPRSTSSSMSSEHYRYPSQGSLGPPPPPPSPGAYAHMTSGEHHRYHSHGRYESWGSLPPPPPPPIPGYGYPQHSGSSWGYRDLSGRQGRDHSLGQNPLAHASVSQSVPYGAFDTRTGSWGPPPDGRSWGPPPPPHGYPPVYHHSGGPPPPPPPAYPTPPPPPPPHVARKDPPGSPSRLKHPSSPPYAVDPAVASAWSGQDPKEIAKTWSGGSGGSSGEEYFRTAPANSNHRPNAHQKTVAPEEHKPEVIKRATSNQNETFETKPDLKGPSVKRAALNRDNSTAANRLKEKYVPGYRKPEFNAEREMRQLSENLEQSTLSSLDSALATTGVKPEPMSEQEKMSTIDQIAMDLMVKPVCFSGTGRSSTIEALALDLEDDPLIKPEMVERSRTVEEVLSELRDGVPKPASLAALDRLTTNDFLDIVNEPIAEDEDMLSTPSRQCDLAAA